MEKLNKLSGVKKFLFTLVILWILLNLVLCIVFNFVGLSFINENTPFILIELIFCFRGWYNSLIVLAFTAIISILLIKKILKSIDNSTDEENQNNYKKGIKDFYDLTTKEQLLVALIMLLCIINAFLGLMSVINPLILNHFFGGFIYRIFSPFYSGFIKGFAMMILSIVLCIVLVRRVARIKDDYNNPAKIGKVDLDENDTDLPSAPTRTGGKRRKKRR